MEDQLTKIEMANMNSSRSVSVGDDENGSFKQYDQKFETIEKLVIDQEITPDRKT